jgi:hypothetical protein
MITPRFLRPGSLVDEFVRISRTVAVVVGGHVIKTWP